ncbi:MAG: ABC transporter permease [Phycisphaerae bacterium]|nr:ABC transporter permease [Phycisphaerae bacterium]
MPPDAQDQPAHAARADAGARARPARPWWLRLIEVQEVGLLLVVALFVVGLTLATPWIPRPERTEVPAGAAVAERDGVITVTAAGGGAEAYRVADGWRVTERLGRAFLERRERTDVPAGAAVTEVPAGFRIVAPGKPDLLLPAADGWEPARDGGVDEVRRTTITGDTERHRAEGGVRIEPVRPAYVVEPAGGGRRVYPADDGWQFVETADGRRTIERDPRVNKFLNKDNLSLVATAASFIAIMAVGMTFIIILGGIDLSVGATYALAAVVGASVLRVAATGGGDLSAWLAVPLGLAVCCGVGALCGLINGAATVGLKVHPFIITLGGMAVYRGVAFVISQGLSITGFPPAYQGTIRASVGGINPLPMLVMLLVGLAGAFVAARTVFGRRTFAIGGNETAARYAGIPVGRTKILLFTLCGALAGLSAAMALGYYGAGSSADGTGYELDVIAAAVVGGASLSGGRGSALGAVLGALIIQLINNGFDVLGIDSNYRQIVIGLAIVLAVVVDQAKQRVLARRR